MSAVTTMRGTACYWTTGSLACASRAFPFPDRLERFIEEMSRYLAANGKSYQNYAAALRIWAGNDKKEAPKKGIPDYSCKEGESL